MIAFLFLLAATARPQEIPRMEPLIEVPSTVSNTDRPDRTQPSTFCTKDKRWCAFLSRDVDMNTVALKIYNGQLPPLVKDGRSYARDVGTYPVNPQGADGGATDNVSLEIWPNIIRHPTVRSDGIKLNETITIGVQAGLSSMYSGGGAQSTMLELYQLSPTIDGRVPDAGYFGTVLNVPLSANKMIRACFGEKDYELRRGACHDEYSFGATITLGKTMPDGTPQLIYQTSATATPGSSSLSADNTGRQLSLADLKPRKDRTCSYRRVYTYSGEFGMYFSTKKVPDCSDFTVP
jgi:hypothetical protein